MALKIEKDYRIDAPIESVFDFIADIENEPLYNAACKSINRDSDDPIGLGTTFTGDYDGFGQLAIELVDFARPSLVASEAHGKVGTIHVSFQLRADGTRTAMHGSFEFSFRGLRGLLAPLMRGKVTKMLDATETKINAALVPTGQPN